MFRRGYVTAPWRAGQGRWTQPPATRLSGEKSLQAAPSAPLLVTACLTLGKAVEQRMQQNPAVRGCAGPRPRDGSRGDQAGGAQLSLCQWGAEASRSMALDLRYTVSLTVPMWAEGRTEIWFT